MTRDMIVVGASAGGVEAVLTLAQALPADLRAAIFVAIHMSPAHGSRMPELVNMRSALRASHPVDGEMLTHGRIYIAPPDNHLILRNALISVARGPKENGNRPSVDALFRSAALSFGPRVIGVVLTGNLDCGTAGLLSIKARGGLALVQDPAEAKARSMPESAIAKVAVDHVVPLSALAALLVRLTQEPALETTAPQLSGSLLELEGEHLGTAAPLVCPLCQGVVTETRVGSYQSFRCHVGHAFSFGAMVEAQAESTERALWSAVRALEEAAALTGRLVRGTTGALRERFQEKQEDQRRQAEVIKQLLVSKGSLSTTDAGAAILPTNDKQ